MLLLTLALPLHAAEPCWLINNFSTEWPSNPSIQSSADPTEKKVGLAAGRFAYQIDRPQGQAALGIAPPFCQIPAPGTLKLWIKGDKSGNQLKLTLWHGKPTTDQQGNIQYAEPVEVPLPAVTLDFDEWRQLTFDATALPADRYLGVRSVAILEPHQQAPKLQGTIWLDELVVIPSAGPKPLGTVSASLVGSRIKTTDTNMVVAVDVRNFTDKPVKTRARLSLTDFNDNAMVDRDTEIVLAAGESKEIAVPVNPATLQPFLPPFRLRGDVLSPDLPDLAGRIEEMIIFGSSYLLFEPFADVRGGWGTAGGAGPEVPNGLRQLEEGFRFQGLPENDLQLKRVEIPPATGTATNPPGRYALRVDFVGSGPVLNWREPARRVLPGDAFRVGFWIKGDGSGARISSIVHDHSDMADFWYGGWKRIYDERLLCALDFQGWRYFEIDLPGNGLGSHTPKGSTDGIDFPLEFTGFSIDARDPSGKRDALGRAESKPGAVEFGPIFVWTQQRTADAMATFVGYDDQDHFWNGAAGAWAIVQNGWPAAGRKFNLTWNLINRKGDAVASGKATAELPAKQMQAVRVDLAPQAAAVQQAEGPLRLQVIATDAADSASSADREIILAKPDSRVPLTGFEEDRAYLHFLPTIAAGAPITSNDITRTSDKQAHSGKRSLVINWNNAVAPVLATSIDPALMGQAVTLSLWLYGDNSGVQFYPIIGDRTGVNKGAPRGQWDLFVPHTLENSPRQFVTIDWTGWRELKFRLPVIPPTWNTDLPVLSFVPSYPLGLHLAVRSGPDTNKTTAATLYVDDITYETHLPSAERVGLEFELAGDGNVIPPQGEVGARIWNSDLTGPRTLKLTGRVRDWRSRQVAGEEQTITLKPGEQQRVVLAKNVPGGAFHLQGELKEGETLRRSAEADLLAADLKPFLGDDWQTDLNESWKLRGPIASQFEVVNEDWDWVEYYPANFQFETAAGRLQTSRDAGGNPYLLLGFSAYWAAGDGFVGSSRVDLQACKLEYSIVSPK